MKLSRTTIATFSAGVIAVLAAGLGVAYAQQGQEQHRMEQELAQTKSRLAAIQVPSTNDLISQQKNLEESLAAAKAKLDETWAKLHSTADSVDITSVILKIAGDVRVDVINVNSLGPLPEKVNGFDFSVITITTKAEGEVPDLLDFIFRIGRQFPTGMVETPAVTVPEPDPIAKEPQRPSVSLVFHVYTYEGE